MKAKRWTAILLSAVLAFSVCMPVSGISTYAAEEAAAETIQPAPEESDSVQTESAASAAEDLTEESSSEDAPAESGSLEEEEAENAAYSDGTQVQENMEDPQEDPANDAAGEAAQQGGQEPFDAGNEDQEAAPVAGAEQDPDSDGQADSVEASFENEDAAETAAPEQSEAADTVSEGQSAAVDTVSEEQSESADTVSEEQNGAQAEDGQTVITEDSGEEKESVEPTEAAAAQETDFDSAVEISVGQTLSAEVTEESPYAFFKFTAQENGVLSVYSTSEFDTYAELFDGNQVCLLDDDESGENSNFLLRFECSEGETYYVRARHYYCESCSFDVTLEKPSFYVDHSYGGSLYKDLNTELDLHARALADTELTYRWYVNEELRQEGASDSFRYLFDQAPANVECRIEDEAGNSDSVWYYIYANCYWDVHPEGGSNVVVENGETCELKVVTDVQEGHENDYEFTYDWMDRDENLLQRGTDPSYTLTMENGPMYVICCVYDQYGSSQTVSFLLYNPGWLNVYPDGAREGTNFLDTYCEPGSGITLYVCDGTDGSSPVHYTWYDEEDQVVDGSGDSSSCELQDITKSCTIRCHAEDENGNSADLMFYVHLNTYLTVYPEGAEDGGTYAWIDIRGKDSVDLHTIAENSAGSAVTYQWQKRFYDPQTGEEVWTNIEGATQETYTVGNPLYVGEYRCCVQDADGNSGTANFSLEADTYFEALVEEDNWSSSIVYDARNYNEVTFAPWATAEEPDRITWQWAKLVDGSEQIIDGESGDTYTVVSPQNGVTYVCIVGDGYGHEIRLYYYFRQNNNLSVTVDEDGNTYMSLDPRTADDFTLTPIVTADDMSQLTYRWSMYSQNGTAVGDEPSLFIHAPEHDTVYYCTVTDQFGNSGYVCYSFWIDTKLRAWPEGMENSFSRSYVIGGLDEITLTAFAQAEEGSEFSWQWYHNGDYMDGENGSTESSADPFRISLDVVSPQNGDEYFVEIWNNYSETWRIRFSLVNEAPALNVYPDGAEEGATFTDIYSESGSDITLYVCNGTDGYFPLHYTWYDEEDQVVDGSGDASSCELQDVRKSRTVRCHVEDENGNSADLMFYVHLNTYLTVYPEGAEDEGTYVWIDIRGKDSVDLHTIAENSAGSAVTYQWQKRFYDPQTGEEVWTNIEGATQETYTVGNPLYVGEYRCCVQDADGNSGTANFFLEADTCFEARVEEDNWSSSIVYDASDYNEVTFAPWATSNDPDRITWQWAKLEDGSEKTIEGENGNTYTVVSPQNGDTYVCIVSDGYGWEIRLYYYFRQNNNLSVTVDEDGRDAMEIDPRTEDDFTLTPLVTADDMSQLTYRWTMYQDEETEVGDAPSLFIDHAPEHGTVYYCTVTDQFGNSGYVSYYFSIDTKLRAWPEGMENSSSRSCVIGGLDEITLTAFAQAEEGNELSWQWYHNYEPMEGESGSLDSPAEPFSISLDVVSPQNGDEYSLEISDKYGDWRTVRFYLVDEAPALNVYPMGAEEGQDTAVVTYNGSTMMITLEVCAAEPTDPGTLSYDWRDSEGNSLGNIDSWIDLHSFADGARYSCTVTDSYGQSATLWFELRWERGEDDPTEAEMENASPISVGDTVDVEVTEEAPTAWFRFVPAESGTYELFSTPKSGNEVDTFASLYNSGGMRLHSDDQSAGNNQFSLEYTFEQGENYYFGVRHYGKESCSFTIQLVSGEKSDWLKEYEYRIDGDRIVLTRYTGETAEITVPGHATARGQEYSCIVLSPYIWDSWYYPVTSLSFEEGVSFPDDSSSLFAGLSNLTSIDLQNVDTANVKNMNGMFSSCSSLSSIDLSTFNASGVESCEGVFDNCTNLQTINTPTGLQADAGLPAAFLDESGNIYSALPKNQTQSLTLTRASASENLKDYNYQVVGDKVRLTSYHGEDNSVVVPGNVTVAGKTYNTVEMTPGMWSEGRWNIKNLSFEQGVVLPADCSGLFKGLWYLTTLDLSVLDWSGVTNMESLFEDCSDLTSLNLSGMDEAQNVTNMHRMFSYCGSLTNLDLSSLNTANVTDMSGMFCGCYGFESLDLGGLDTHSVTNMSEMFESCDNLKTINISGFDTANVTDMSYMFAGCSSLTGLDLSGFQTDALTNVRSMFRNCSSLTALDLSSFDASAVEHISYMVKGCSALATINSPVNLTKTTNLPAVYEGSDGTLYGIMPRNLNKSVVLVYSRDFKPGESGDPEALNTVGKAEITLSPASFTYSGTECKPEAKVVFEGKVLTQGTDYIVTYSNNTAAGQAAVTVTGMGIYGGKAVKNFTIAKAALADSGVTVSASGLVYNGKAQTPAVTVKFGSTTLVEGTDYTKAYSNNTNAGTASVTVTGKGNYQGAVTKNYTIAKAALANSSATVSASGLVYNGKAQTPAVTVKSGSATLVEGTDYTKAYSNNTNAGTASVAVTGKGNYQGTVTKTFTIAKAAQSITAKAAAATVSVGKTTTVTVTGAKGGVTYSSSNAALAAVTTAGKVTAKKVGSVNITVKAAATANYNAASKTVAIKVVPAATKTLKAANLAKGIKLTWAKVAGASGYIIYRNNKKVKTVGGPAVTWSDTGANSNGTKYVYKVFAKASTGTSTLSKSVTIYRVARPAVSSVKNSASKKMTVKWGKNAKATGYQIQYSLKKNFSGAKTVNVAKAATVSKDIGGLQKGKTYYVRIKTYKKVGKVKYESVWSTAKTVKITR